jgi:hypothetical protein
MTNIKVNGSLPLVKITKEEKRNQARKREKNNKEKVGGITK